MSSKGAFFVTDPFRFRPALSCFLKYWAQFQAGAGALRSAVRALDGELARGTDPLAVHQRYGWILSGSPVEQVAEHAGRWAATQVAADPLFAVVRAAVRHRRQECGQVFLVSDSIGIVASSVMRAIGASGMVCSRAVVNSDGLLTGDIRDPVVGAHKVDALRRFAESRDLDPARCGALGVTHGDVRALGEVAAADLTGLDT